MRTRWPDLPLPQKQINRFYKRTNMVDGGCWFWKGAYVFTYKQESYTPRDISYMIAFGEPPETKIHVSCNVCICVNPAHFLEPMKTVKLKIKETLRPIFGPRSFQFMAMKVIKKGSTGCLEQIDDKKHRIGGVYHEQRAAWWWYFKRKAPPEPIVMICNNPKCVNPAHMKEETNEDVL